LDVEPRRTIILCEVQYIECWNCKYIYKFYWEFSYWEWRTLFINTLKRKV